MRFKKGSKVEVLSKKEVSAGSWLCAEIISGNGHMYSVRYGWFPVTSEAIVDRVPRKVIRPCPPPLEVVDNWVPGDHVEVFHNMSWNRAIIVKVLGMNNFVVRLVGASKEFRVHRSQIRVQQSWQNGKWLVLGRCSACSTTLMNTTLADGKPKLHGGECFAVNGTPEDDISTRSLKRGSPDGWTHGEAYPFAVHKARVIEKNGSPQQRFSKHPSPLFEKVDAHVTPQQKLGDKYMHTSFQIGTSGTSEMDLGRQRPNWFSDSFISETSLPTDTESIASSVGSCSLNGDVYHRLHPIRYDSEDAESHSGDAESIYGWGNEEGGYVLSQNEKLAEQNNRLELHTYRSTIKALHASGHLSWEDQARLMNLRRALHISDDEHLVEIRNLIAVDTRTTIL